MIQLIKTAEAPEHYDILFNGRKIGTTTRTKEDDSLMTDSFLDFDFKKIEHMRAMDLPEYLDVAIDIKKPLLKVFDMMGIVRKGNGVIIGLNANVNPFAYEGDRCEWLMWHPLKFANVFYKIADAKGFGISKYADKDFDNIDVDFYFRLTGDETLGLLLGRALDSAAMILKETDEVLMKRVRGK